MAAVVRGTGGNDTLATDDEVRRIIGGRGDDHLTTGDAGGTALGGMGDDTLIGGGIGRVQSHLYGGPGADTIYLDIADRSAPFGDHVWGEEGADRFVFIGRAGGSERITGRIDDFDVSRDQIWIDDQRLDLRNPPEGVRIVALYGQPWLLIDERALFSLEGARAVDGLTTLPAGTDAQGDLNGEERHFIAWPEEWANGVPRSADVPYTDLYSYFPANEAPARDWEIPTPAYTSQNDTIIGTDGQDRIIGGDGADRLEGGAGDDLIHGFERADLIFGGTGNDSISGGLDNDTIYGGPGEDIVYGGGGHDRIYGDSGHDSLAGNNGFDLIYGGAGNDTISGGWDSDTLYGGAGDDVLYAATDPDPASPTVIGRDQLFGGEGNDTLYAAQYGFATMSGGEGEDRFVLAPDSQTVLTDFLPGYDFLDLNGLSPGPEALERSLTMTERNDGSGRVDFALALPGAASVIFQDMEADARAALLASIGQSGPIDPPAPRPDPDDPEDPDDPDRPGEEEEDGGGGGCFVATTCYGGAAHPDVAWLRAYRSQVLRHSAGGRAFIRFYAFAGPLAARLIAPHPRLRRFCRNRLAALVRFGQARVQLR